MNEMKYPELVVPVLAKIQYRENRSVALYDVLLYTTNFQWVHYWNEEPLEENYKVIEWEYCRKLIP